MTLRKHWEIGKVKVREKINEYLNLLTIFNNRQHQGRVNEKLIIVKIFTKHV